MPAKALTDRGPNLSWFRSSGIGKASAEALARAGFTVFGTRRRASKRLEWGGPFTKINAGDRDDLSRADAMSALRSESGRDHVGTKVPLRAKSCHEQLAGPRRFSNGFWRHTVESSEKITVNLGYVDLGHVDGSFPLSPLEYASSS